LLCSYQGSRWTGLPNTENITRNNATTQIIMCGWFNMTKHEQRHNITAKMQNTLTQQHNNNCTRRTICNVARRAQ
jgi:hypothetical protein